LIPTQVNANTARIITSLIRRKALILFVGKPLCPYGWPAVGSHGNSKAEFARDLCHELSEVCPITRNFE
jgi:hypothetical protein